MGKKIVFFDIDGTLIDVPNGLTKPTEETIHALNEFKKRGNYIIVATARGVIPESLKEIKWDGYICCDGHYIEIEKQILIDNIFTTEQIKEQISLYDKYNAEYVLGGHHGGWYSDLKSPLVIEYQRRFVGMEAISNDIYENWEPYNVKANFLTPLFNTAEDMIQCRDELSSDWAINSYEKDLVRMDVHLQGFSKGTACQYVVNHLSIDPENAYAFGDGENDKEMLELIRNSVAMGNAATHIKEYANDVTDTVSNNGIAQAFKKYFDIKK